MELYWMGTIGFFVLRERGFDVNLLPRDIIEKDTDNE